MKFNHKENVWESVPECYNYILELFICPNA